MQLIFREIAPRDEGKAIDFAIDGMHFECYFKGAFGRRLFGRYFWYLEMLRATQIIAAYDVGERGESGENDKITKNGGANGELVGVLLADMMGEKCHKNLAKSLFVRVFELVGGLFLGRAGARYQAANNAMFEAFAKSHATQGEICFFATKQGRGVGTALLGELARRESGKRVHLFTDSDCNFGFYERRGFARLGEMDITLELNKQTPLKCFLYSKIL